MALAKRKGTKTEVDNVGGLFSEVINSCEDRNPMKLMELLTRLLELQIQGPTDAKEGMEVYSVARLELLRRTRRICSSQNCEDMLKTLRDCDLITTTLQFDTKFGIIGNCELFCKLFNWISEGGLGMEIFSKSSVSNSPHLSCLILFEQSARSVITNADLIAIGNHVCSVYFHSVDEQLRRLVLEHRLTTSRVVPLEDQFLKSEKLYVTRENRPIYIETLIQLESVLQFLHFIGLKIRCGSDEYLCFRESVISRVINSYWSMALVSRFNRSRHCTKYLPRLAGNLSMFLDKDFEKHLSGLANYLLFADFDISTASYRTLGGRHPELEREDTRAGFLQSISACKLCQLLNKTMLEDTEYEQFSGIMKRSLQEIELSPPQHS